MNTRQLRLLGRHVATQLDALEQVSEPDADARQVIAEHAAGRRPAAVQPRRWIATAGAAALAITAVIAIFFVALKDRSSPPLSFTVGSPPEPGMVRDWVSAGSRPVPVVFSDGSRVTLDPGSRARVTTLTPRGAEMVLESGRARVEVRHRDGSEWQLRTGPFVVQVIGTRFDVAWDAAADRLSLELFEGRVLVSGCAFGHAQAVFAGHRVQASCAPERRFVSVVPIGESPNQHEAERQPDMAASAGAAEPSAAPPVEQSVESLAGSELPRVAQARATINRAQRPLPRKPSWLELAREGRYARAYEEIVRIGFDEEMSRHGAAEVLLLGDAARLSGDAARARTAYLSIRNRFRNTPAAARAAFNLGRLDARAGAATSAARWFDAYLKEEPAGALAAAALGRLLEMSVAAGEQARAQRLARRYLERHPTGAHAREARRILGRAGTAE